MERFAPQPDQIAHAIHLSPGWCRVGLTFGDGNMRARTERELARSIAERLQSLEPDDAADQLALPF